MGEPCFCWNCPSFPSGRHETKDINIEGRLLFDVLTWLASKDLQVAFGCGDVVAGRGSLLGGLGGLRR